MATKTQKTETQATATDSKTFDMVEINQRFNGVKSQMIKYLASEGQTVAQITKSMKQVYPQFLYQHARNVLTQKSKKAS